MPSALDRLDFGPQRDAGAVRSIALALLIHAALIAALTWGVSWKRTDRSITFEAELWSNTPQEAAPKLEEPPTPPEPEPKLAPKVPDIKPATPDIDIALEQEKKRKLQAQQDKAEKELKRRQEQDQAKLKAAEDRKKAESKKQLLQEQDKAREEAQRLQNIARAMGLAGATGGETAKGNALISSGPSASYQNRLAALFKRNITFSNAQGMEGNPKAEVRVKVSSTGFIMSSRLTKSSGVKAWDEAVLRAIEKTERIPLDENGKVVTEFPIEFGPKD